MKAYRTEGVFNELHLCFDLPIKINFPSGCLGIQFVFKTKKQLRQFAGKNARLGEVVVIQDDSNQGINKGTKQSKKPKERKGYGDETENEKT